MLVMQCYDINSLSVANLIEVLSRSTDPTLSIPSANRRKKKWWWSRWGNRSLPAPCSAAFNVMLCFLFCFWGTGDIPGTQLFGLNCKQLPTPNSREQTLSPTGSEAFLFLWNHSNRVAFKICHFTFSLLSAGKSHKPTKYQQGGMESQCAAPCDVHS